MTKNENISASLERGSVDEITSRDVDFAKWYTDIVKKTELMEYSSVRGCMIILPYGFAIWENIKNILDAEFKKLGHQNVSMPLFIPESLLQKEKDHVEGFAPEVCFVTQGGEETLTERLCVRPTSETLFCDYYSKAISSYRDLPKLYNQWCSVVRWEKTSRPFLRSVEFHWQEGHTVHADEEDARKETLQMLDVYTDFCEKKLAIPVIRGQKTDKEKFSGALDTYTIESMMYDGKALQSGTSHYFGDGFARAFGIEYTGKDNERHFCHQTSWGMSTRIIGAIIMVHGDDRGLNLPPAIAPYEIVIVPIASHKEGVIEKATKLHKDLIDAGFRVHIDTSDKSAGFKFSEYEMKGVPLRLEIGPKDIEKNQCVLVRRCDGEKIISSLDSLESTIKTELSNISSILYEKAKTRRDSMTYKAESFDELKKIAEEKPGFIKASWCGELACEEKIKDEASLTSRCIPFTQEDISENCVCCGKKKKHTVIFGKAY